MYAFKKWVAATIMEIISAGWWTITTAYLTNSHNASHQQICLTNRRVNSTYWPTHCSETLELMANVWSTVPMTHRYNTPCSLLPHRDRNSIIFTNACTHVPFLWPLMFATQLIIKHATSCWKKQHFAWLHVLVSHQAIQLRKSQHWGTRTTICVVEFPAPLGF